MYGTYDLILENHPSIFAYVRTWKDEQLLVIANFTENECLFELPKEITYYLSELVIHNYDVQDGTLESFVLQPYEARVYKLKS